MTPSRRAVLRRVARACCLGWAALTGLVLLAGAAGQATADAPSLFVVDPERSQVRFRAVSRLMNADGSFSRLTGEIRVDPAHPAEASGRIAVPVASIDTGIRIRDTHLRSEDFLHVKSYPEATFVTSTVQRDGSRWVVSGGLTIRGITQPIRMPLIVDANPGALRVTGEVTVSRRDFGIRYDSVLNPIRDEVRVWVDLTATVRN